ncbi:MAG: M20/M25/M40 family metallo-hydrolase [Bacteroidota bacterium]
MKTRRNSAMKALIVCLILITTCAASAQLVHDELVDSLLAEGLRTCRAYDLLVELTSKAPHRLSGSEGAAKAVEVTKEMMERLGFDNVHLEKVMVPHWVRGSVESAVAASGGQEFPLTICALGGSIATPKEGITAGVIEVQSFEELQALGGQAKGKIIFYNRPMDPTRLNTFEAYGGAVNQRSQGAIEAARVGALAVLVRSMTLRLDDVPHTGVMGYADTIPKIPAAAISTLDANWLSGILKKTTALTVRMILTCETLPDVESANVVGEVTGSEKPEEIIVIGGHLDAWDKGSGAHDDGSGCVQAIEAVSLIKRLGLKPKRTIRAVMFMNEENGTRGGKAYPVAHERKREKHIAAMESDAGGHAPRGVGVQADSIVLAKVLRWKPLFEKLFAGNIGAGHGGVDIGPLIATGVPGFGLSPETHRYFDYHHSDNDTIDKVHPRELEMGAIVEALLCWLIAEEGL